MTKRSEFNLMSTKEHKGFGAGALDLSTLSSMIIDGEEAYVDLGAIHAKSKVEKGIKFSANKEDVPNGRLCWIVWVKVGRTDEGSYYAGLSACEMLIDTDARRGYKLLPDHVNRMDAAMKHKFLIEGLNDTEKNALRNALIAHNESYWERSPEQLKELLS